MSSATCHPQKPIAKLLQIPSFSTFDCDVCLILIITVLDNDDLSFMLTYAFDGVDMYVTILTSLLSTLLMCKLK